MTRSTRVNICLALMIAWSVLLTPTVVDELFRAFGPMPWRPWKVSILSAAATFPLWFFGLGGICWWAECHAIGRES